MQAKPFDQRGSLAQTDVFEGPRSAWDASGPGYLETAPPPAMTQQHVEPRDSIGGRRRQRRHRKTSTKASTKAFASSRYLSNTTVCAKDKKTNKKKPFHLYGWGNTRPVGRTAFLGSSYMKSRNTAASSVALLAAPTNQPRVQHQVEDIIENNSQDSVFASSTIRPTMQHKNVRLRTNTLEDVIAPSAPSFSSDSQRPGGPSVPMRTASRAYARKMKKQNAVIDSMVSHVLRIANSANAFPNLKHFYFYIGTQMAAQRISD